MRNFYFLLFIIIITLSGCSNPFLDKGKSNPPVSSEEQAPFQYTEPLSVNDITTALQAAGLQFKKTQLLNPIDYQIDAINPVIYKLKQSDHFLLLYNYKSIAQRKEAAWTGDYFFNFGSRELLPHKNSFSRNSIAKNFLIIDMFDIEKAQQDYPAYNQVSLVLKKALFNLNDIQQMVFTVQSNNWAASLNVEYYQHWYKDDQDRIGVDQYYTKKWLVKYLGPDPESIHTIRYEYSDSNGSGGGSGSENGGVVLNKIGSDYYLRIGGSGGNGGMPVKDSVYTLTIHWNNQEELLQCSRLLCPYFSQTPKPGLDILPPSWPLNELRR